MGKTTRNTHAHAGRSKEAYVHQEALRHYLWLLRDGGERVRIPRTERPAEDARNWAAYQEACIQWDAGARAHFPFPPLPTKRRFVPFDGRSFQEHLDQARAALERSYARAHQDGDPEWTRKRLCGHKDRAAQRRRLRQEIQDLVKDPGQWDDGTWRGDAWRAQHFRDYD